jgi:regulator of sigma E protease
MLTLGAFIVALAVLIVVHEAGHFVIARMSGVKVLRFSVGFGPRLAGWTSSNSGTEYALCLVPLGGYVQMLDETNVSSDPMDSKAAFNNQPLIKKTAIVAAGPLANLLLAFVLYCVVNWTGIEQPVAVLAKPPVDSVMAKSGLAGGEQIVQAGFEDDRQEPVVSFDSFRLLLVQAAMNRRNVQVEFHVAGATKTRTALLVLADVDGQPEQDQLLQKIGVVGPFSKAQVGALTPNGAAEKAGLLPGDVVTRVDQTDIVDAAQLRGMIRLAGRQGVTKQQMWSVIRKNEELQISVFPQLVQDGGNTIGRVGAFIGSQPAVSRVQYDWLNGFVAAFRQTSEITSLTIRAIGQVVSGTASIKSVSGPLTIAEYAGKSASVGPTQFVLFLALMSVSLAVLNLLPVPMLDGGHLMYYLWEALSGKPVAQRWIERTQKLGFATLLLLMSIALVNDVTRLLL